MSVNSGVYKTLQVVLTANASSFQSTMYTAVRTTQALNTEFDGLNSKAVLASKNSTALGSSLESTSKSATLLKTGLAGLGIVAVIGFGQVISASLQFDKNMRNVTSLIAGSGASTAVANQQYSQLSKTVLDLSKIVPQSANDLAKGLYNVVSSGFTTATDASNVLKASATAAAAGLSTTDTAVTALTGVINAYGYSASQAQQVSDALFQTVNLGVVTFPQLAQGIGEVTTVAAAGHVPITDLGAAIATITRAGIQPDQAFTGLTRTIQSIINPGAKLTAVFQQLGYESGASALQTLGLQGTIEKLRTTTGGAVTTIDALFKDVRAQRTVFALMAQDGQLYDSVASQFGQNNAYVGATMRALSEQSKSAAFQFDLFKNNVESSSIALFQKATPALAGLLGNINALTTQGFSELGKEVRTLEPDLAEIVKGLVSVGTLAGHVVADIAPLSAGFIALQATVLADTLSLISRGIISLDSALEHVRPEVETLVAIVGTKYVVGLAAATTETVLLTTAELGMIYASGLSAIGLTNVGGGAKIASRSVAGLADSIGAMDGALLFSNPIVLATAAVLGTVAFAFLEHEDAQKKDKKATEDFTKAILEQQNGTSGAINAALNTAAAQQKYSDTIKDLGINQGLVNQTIQGTVGAEKELSNQLLTQATSISKNKDQQKLLTEALNGNHSAAVDLFGILEHTNADKASLQVGQLALGLSKTSDQFKNARAAAAAEAQSINSLGDSSLNAGKGLSTLASDADLSNKKFADLSAQVKELQGDISNFSSPKTVFDDLYSKAQQAQSAAQSAALADHKQSLKDQENAIRDSYTVQINAAEKAKLSVQNNSAGAKSAIQGEINIYKQQENAQIQALQTTQSTSSASATAVSGFTQSATVSLNDYVAELVKKNQDQIAWEKNLATIYARAGADGTDLTFQLAKLGPNAASLVAQLATASDQEFSKAADSIIASSNQISTEGSQSLLSLFQIMAEKSKEGAQATAQSIATVLNTDVNTVQQIAQQYGLALANAANPILTATGQPKIQYGPFAPGTVNPNTGIKVHADGGIENHTAQIAQGSTPYRIWAEPETGGEAYIPLAQHKAPNSIPILRTAAANFGLHLVDPRNGGSTRFASGGLNLGSFGFPIPPVLPSYLIADMASGTDNLAYQSALALAQQKQGSNNVPAGPAPAGTVVDWIHAAEQIAGWPDAYTNGIYQLIQAESGGNPRAINNSDINARNGNNSRGLTQTIPATFNAYKFPGHDDIYNPVDNILAGISYALKNYGPGMVEAGGRHNAQGKYIGYGDGGIHRGTYDNGGALMPGWTMAYNGTGKPETVVSEDALAKAFTRALAESGGSGKPNIGQVVIQESTNPMHTVNEVRRQFG